MNELTMLLGAATLTLSAAANATILTVFDGITDGVADFDSNVIGAGGTVDFDIWSGLFSGASIDRGDYVITQNDGGSGSVTTYGSMSGQVIGINPDGGGSSPRTDPMDYFDSGISFTFTSAINSIGFEVGDWATCCHDPSTDLYISFDGGSPIQVASAIDNDEGLFPSQSTGSDVYEIFIAAFDDSGSFTEVSFWGNGVGEYLVAGGQVRYALLAQGSLPPTNPVPAPAALGLVVLGLYAATRRKLK